MSRAVSANLANRLGTWVSGLSLKQVPDETLRIARRCILDTSAVAIAGSRTPVAEKLRAHVSEQYGSGPCTLLGTAQGATAIGAALVNGTAAHALDFDDTSYAGVVHGSAVVLPAVLAAAEHANINGAGVLGAFIAGSEVAYALGLTLTDSHYMSGWWATGTLGSIAAAAGASRALGLDTQDSTAAIALAALQANGMIAVLGYEAKPILAGQAARLGTECALLAAQGNAAPPQVFEDRRGFLRLMNEGKSNAAGLAGLGEVWRLVNPGVAVKRAPVCSAAQAAIELTEILIQQNGLERTQIAHVRCEVPHLVKISLIHDRPETPPEAQFSMPFAIGCILAFGKLGPEQISADALADSALQTAMTKVEMVEADELNGSEFQPHYPECVRVTVTTSDGRECCDFLGAATGMPEKPFSDEALSDKFRRCASFAGWSEERCEATLSRLWDIENAPSVTELVQGEVACTTP